MKAEYLSHMGDDTMVTNCARVSFRKWKDKFDESDVRLIYYLAKHAHWTPFSHPQVQLRITAPIFVARQWFRSTVGVARNEVSRRYVDDLPEFYCPDDWRSRPDGSIKQGSGEPVSEEALGEATHQRIKVEAICVNAYDKLVNEYGIAPEQARMILPQSMETQWIETGSLAYFARICKQRTDSHAQAEIQELAMDVSDIIKPLFPVSWLALLEN